MELMGAARLQEQLIIGVVVWEMAMMMKVTRRVPMNMYKILLCSASIINTFMLCLFPESIEEAKK